MTRHEIADATNLPLSSVCGRVNELMKSGECGLQVVAGRRVRRDGRNVVQATFHVQRAG